MWLKLQVWLCLSLALCCLSVPVLEDKKESPVAEDNNESLPSVSDIANKEKSSTRIVRQDDSKNNSKSQNNNKSSGMKGVDSSESKSNSDESDGNGVSHIIKHSKLFTEFLSFAINPYKTLDVLKSNLMEASTNQSSGGKRGSGTNSTSQESLPAAPSSAYLQDLFVEIMKMNSPGFIVSYDYSNTTEQKTEGDNALRKPIRIWGIIPDEKKNKTLYFLVDHSHQLYNQIETKATIKEQVEDFEIWKQKAIAHPSDDKLGDGTIGSLIG